VAGAEEGENMKKEDIIKFFVIAVVALFVIEMLALGAAMAGDTSSPSSQGQSGRGFIDVNATVDYYEPAISVVGQGSALEAAIAQLKAEGKVDYEGVDDYGVRTLTLSLGTSVKEATGRLRSANATVGVFASLIIPSAEVITPSGSYVAAGGSVRYPLNPDVEPGGQVHFSATVNVESGQIVSFENIVVRSTEASSAIVQAQFVDIGKGTYVALVPWESRRISRDALLEELKKADENATLSYEEKSYAVPDVPLTQQQADALGAQLPSYVVSVGTNAISVSRDFTDANALRMQLLQFGVQAQFPSSRIVFFLFPNESAQEGKAPQAAAIALNNSGINFTSIMPLQSYKITLPQSFYSDGAQYSLEEVQREYEMALNASGYEGNASVLVEFEHVGERVTLIKSIRQVQ